MAMSDWDTMAFDSDGKPANGSLTIPGGAGVEIYKNWLYVRNPKTWKKGQFTSPVVAQIQHGEISTAGLEIVAIRHPDQHSVFCFVSHREYTGRGKKKYDSHQDYYLAGIGCYGFKSEQDWLKVKHPKIYDSIDPKYWDEEKFMMTTTSSFGGGKKETWGYEWYPTGEDKSERKSLIMKVKKPDLNEMWAGVTPSTSVAFFAWLEKVAPKEYFVKIDQDNVLRFNQGDAFFANALDSPLGATAPGKSKGTIMGQMLKKATKKVAKK